MSYSHLFLSATPYAARVEVQKRKARAARRRRRRNSSRTSPLEKRVAELEDNLGFVSLVLASVMAQLEEHDQLSRADLAEIMKEFDGADGDEDGQLDVEVLRDLTE